MSIRAILHNAIAAAALIMIVISILILVDCLLYVGVTVGRIVTSAGLLFGGTTILKVIGEWEY